MVVGLIVGIVIGRSAEYYTSQSYKPTQRLAKVERQVRHRYHFRYRTEVYGFTTIPVLAVVGRHHLIYWLASGCSHLKAAISNGLEMSGLGKEVENVLTPDR